MSAENGVEAVERALKILDCFSPSQQSLTLADMARQTGLYKSTILRLIVSLERFGYLIREESGRYRLGATVWRLGTCYRSTLVETEILRPELQHLSAATNETASFFVREGDSRVCLLRSEPRRSIRHSLTVGSQLPLTRGASGRVLLAFSGDDSETSAAVRAAGYAATMGERDPEVAAIAVPIRSHDGILLGALTISGLITRFTPEYRDSLLRELRDSQERLSGRV